MPWERPSAQSTGESDEHGYSQWLDWFGTSFSEMVGQELLRSLGLE